MADPRDIRDVYYTVPATGVYQAGEGRGLIRRRYTAGARIPMAVAIQFGMPGAAEREPTPGGEPPADDTATERDALPVWYRKRLEAAEAAGETIPALEGGETQRAYDERVAADESTQVDPANSDAGETHADNVAGTGGVNSTDTPPVNSTDTSESPFEVSDLPDADDFGDLPPETDEDRAFVADLAAGLIKNAKPL